MGGGIIGGGGGHLQKIIGGGAITETWLNPTISSLEVLPHGYDIYRKDREDRILVEAGCYSLLGIQLL